MFKDKDKIKNHYLYEVIYLNSEKMRKFVYLLLVCLLAAGSVSCKKDKRVVNRELEKSIVGQWNLTECYDKTPEGNVDRMADMVKEDYPYTYTFNDNHSGQLDCHFCKKMNFTFRIYGQGDLTITYSDKEESVKKINELTSNTLIIEAGIRVLSFERLVKEEEEGKD